MKIEDLTQSMRDALDALATNYDLWVSRGKPETQRYTVPIGARPNTLEALANRGLVVVNYRVHGYTMAQITEVGYVLARGVERP